MYCCPLKYFLIVSASSRCFDPPRGHSQYPYAYLHLLKAQWRETHKHPKPIHVCELTKVAVVIQLPKSMVEELFRQVAKELEQMQSIAMKLKKYGQLRLTGSLNNMVTHRCDP